MFCPACGQEASEGAQFCQHCGQPLSLAAMGAAIPGAERRFAARVRYAGFWRRFWAYCIDNIIVVIAGIGAGAVIAFILRINVALRGRSLGSSKQTWAFFLFLIVSELISWLYWAFMESSPTQATLGKMALGIEVTDLKGSRLSFARATGRFFGKIISRIILYIGFMMAGWTEKKQALHDIMAGTLVVRKQAAKAVLGRDLPEAP
jgi:uncharacterized RDD family membrane protein YckC